MPDRPLCFVLMPFGRKSDPAGGAAIDFDAVYQRGLRPGIEDAGMTPIRADEEKLGGIIHQAMFERLLLCDFAVADLTTANPNVLYELGVRHAARPRTTLTVYAAQKPLPFDVGLLRTQDYQLTAKNKLSAKSAERLRASTAEHLTSLRELARQEDVADSPLFQLVSAWRPQQLPAAAANSFREQVRSGEALKRRLEAVRRMAGSADTEPEEARATVHDLHASIRKTDTADLGVWTDLLLAYRALGDWSSMIEVHAEMPHRLRRQPAVRQLVAFAHNRLAEDPDTAHRDERRATALSLLDELEEERGASSETYGLRGRVFKAQWIETDAAGDHLAAAALLQKAVDQYVRGFEADWRDYYPGVNAVTLLDVQGTPVSLATKGELMPVVRYALEQRAQTEAVDYWVSATRLELAVLDDDPERAARALGECRSQQPERWQRSTTAGNLRLIRRARATRGVEVTWLDALISGLDRDRPSWVTPCP
ncbi:TRAFs-binding domain-containing protein [Modestobacter excelsi]|uniref:TRAFs-binding domain-containing protein n=1 Tax=Modestobacter excelsi TaxID=2213161 RepID=UPI00110CAD4B|nr:TRAFs-binding domain-containing protein [Modestobacter excelsi]